MVKLSNIKKGQKAQILEFDSKETSCLSCRLGLCKGDEVVCLQRSGAIILQNHNQNLAVGKKLSKDIYVDII